MVVVEFYERRDLSEEFIAITHGPDEQVYLSVEDAKRVNETLAALLDQYDARK